MRWAAFTANHTDEERLGLIHNGQILAHRPGVTLIDLLGDDGAKLSEAADMLSRAPHEVFEVASVHLLPPISRPPSIRDFMTFRSHVEAGFAARGLAVPSVFERQPPFYFTNPRALLGANDPVPMPKETRCLDFEFEVAAIVGKDGRDLDPSEAWQHIAGFCIFNDWSARDLQREEMEMLLGPNKSKDFASTLGPWLVTREELEPFKTGNGYDLAMVVFVNGREYGRDRWCNASWGFGQILSHASQGTWISKGDVLASGTCGSGCLSELRYRQGAAMFPWLEIGDEVTMQLDGVGHISNTIIAGS